MKCSAEYRAAAEFDSLQALAAYVVMNSYTAANAKQLAAELECSVASIYQKASPNTPKMFNARDIEAIVKVYRDPRLLDYLANLMDHLAVANPALDPETDGNPTDRAAGEVVRDVGDLMIAHEDARSVDGPGGRGYTKAEKLRVIAKILAAMKSLSRFLWRVRREEVVDG